MSGTEHCCRQFADLSGLSEDEVKKFGSCGCIQAKEALRDLEAKYDALLKAQQRAGLRQIGEISDRSSEEATVCAYCNLPSRPWRKDASCDCRDYECGSAFDCGESVTEPRGFKRSKACERIEELQDRVEQLEVECLRLRTERDDIQEDTVARLADGDIGTSGLALLAETIMDEALHRPDARVWQVFSNMAKTALEEVGIFYNPDDDSTQQYGVGEDPSGRADATAELVQMLPEMADAILAWHQEGTSGSRLNGIDGPVEQWAEVVENLKKIAERLLEIKEARGE